MAKVLETGKPIEKRPTARTGRPPRELAGEVETRILDAARRVFLERGFAAASIDEIAGVAGAGKPTIYARYPGKEALFAAVMVGIIDASVARFASYEPTGASVEENLTGVGVAVLQWALVADTVDFLRLGIAEARRFPDLASSVHKLAREHGAQAVGRLLGKAASSDDLGKLPAFAPDRLATTSRFFLDLVLLPMLMRALHGENLTTLHAEIGPHVARSVNFFLAGCRHGGIE
jgi:AcrR family transcriptional regulator